MYRIPLLLLSVLLLTQFSCKHPEAKETNPAYLAPNIKPFTDVILKDTSNARAYYSRGNALSKAGNDTLALLDFERAVKLDTTRGEYYSAIGDLLFEHKDITGSVKWMERALKKNPGDPKAHLKVAKLMLFTKEYPKAFLEINTVLRHDAYNPEGYYLKGLIYKDLKDTAKAISSFQTVVNVAPDYRDAHIQLGLLYLQKNDQLGLKYLDNAFKLDSSDVLPIYAKGMYYQDHNDYATAKTFYKDCIIRNQQYEDAYFNTGWILLQEDSLEKARRQFDLVTKINPASARAYYNRGYCSELMHNDKDAVVDYTQALTFDKEMALAKEGLKRLGTQQAATGSTTK